MRPTQPIHVLVTGANGFVGRALCAALVRCGHAVRAAVRGTASIREVGSGEVVRVGEIDGHTDWSSALRDVDVVVHLAARVHVVRDKDTEPWTAFHRVNVEGSVHLAQQAAHAGVKRLVFLSSIKVNGERTPAAQAFSEQDPAQPQDGYGRSKWEAEQGLHRIASASGMAATIIRPPLVYGPGAKANFAALVSTVKAGWPLPLASVRNQRSLIAIGNLVDFIITCTHHPAAANQTFLVSDGEDLSTPELVRRLARAMGTTARLLPLPPTWLYGLAAVAGKRDAMHKLCGDLRIDGRKAKDLLGWQPPLTVDAGLQQAVGKPGKT